MAGRTYYGSSCHYYAPCMANNLTVQVRYGGMSHSQPLANSKVSVVRWNQKETGGNVQARGTQITVRSQPRS